MDGAETQRGQKRTIAQINEDADEPEAGVFVNNFAGADSLVVVTKKPRKKRSDAGVKRGPRKNRTQGASCAPPATA